MGFGPSQYDSTIPILAMLPPTQEGQVRHFYAFPAPATHPFPAPKTVVGGQTMQFEEEDRLSAFKPIED